jgi:hypothetical protein
MNPYMGDMPLEINGERLTLAYTWEAVSRARAELGADGLALAQNGDLSKLAAFAAIGLARHHPDWTAERIFEASPPIVPTTNAVEEAWLAAHFGLAMKPKEKKDDAENPLMPPPTRLKRLWRRLSGQG